VPGNFAPRVADFGADHGLGNAVRMRGIAKRETSFYARVPAIGLAILVGNHAHDLCALHFRVEGAAYAAISASRGDTVIRLTFLNYGFLDQSCRWACLNTSAARNALRLHERLAFAWRDHGSESTSIDGER